MPRRRGRPPSIARPQDPHPVLPEVERFDVGKLQVKKGDVILASFEPSSTYLEIDQAIKEAHGRGDYTIVALDIASGRPLRAHRRLRIRDLDLLAPPVRRIGEAFEVVGGKKGAIPDDELSMFRERHRIYNAEEERRREDQKAHGKRMATERAELNQALQDTQKEQSSFVFSFLERQSALDREAKEREEERRREWMMQQQMQQEQQRTDTEAIQRRGELERRQRVEEERAYHDRVRQDREAEHQRRLVEERAQAEGRLQGQQIQFEQQRELQQQQMDLQIKTLKAEMEAKYRMQEHSGGLPKDIQRELFKRQLDQDWPKKSKLEEFSESYVEPLLDAYRQIQEQRGAAQPLPAVITPETFAENTAPALVQEGGPAVGGPTHIPGFPGSGTLAPPPSHMGANGEGEYEGIDDYDEEEITGRQDDDP